MGSSNVTLDLVGTPVSYTLPPEVGAVTSSPNEPWKLWFGLAVSHTKINYWLPDISVAGFLRAQENSELFEGQKPHPQELVKNGVRLAHAKVLDHILLQP